MPETPNHRKPWTHEENEYLQYNWGEKPLIIMARKLGRTPWAVLVHGSRNLKLGTMHRGTWSLRMLSDHSGFSVEKIKNAIEKLGIVVRRSHTGAQALKGRKRSRRRALTEDQAEALIDYMLDNPQIYRDEPGAKRTTRGVWGVGSKPAYCVKCGTTEKPHEAKGFCTSCYQARFRREYVKSSGPRRGGKRLSDEQVLCIRHRRRETGQPYDKIAAEFGVTRQAISYIVRGKYRREVGGPIEGEE